MAVPSDLARRDHDCVIKLLIMGDAGVGKSTLLRCFSDDPSSDTAFFGTIGIDFKVRIIELDDIRVKLLVWNTADQRCFRTITSAYYRGTMGILLVYDVTVESSFNNIRNWIQHTKQHASDNVIKALIGNKVDMDRRKRVVPTFMGQTLADEYGIKFFETSAKTNQNTEQVFFSIARDVKEMLTEQHKSTKVKAQDAMKTSQLCKLDDELDDEGSTTSESSCWCF